MIVFIENKKIFRIKLLKSLSINVTKRYKACLYQDADVYLFDDILSAQDTHVAENIMRDTIYKSLKNKTRVLVTHSVQHLPYADWIYVIGITF